MKLYSTEYENESTPGTGTSAALTKDIIWSFGERLTQMGISLCDFEHPGDRQVLLKESGAQVLLSRLDDIGRKSFNERLYDAV